MITFTIQRTCGHVRYHVYHRACSRVVTWIFTLMFYYYIFINLLRVSQSPLIRTCSNITGILWKFFSVNRTAFILETVVSPPPVLPIWSPRKEFVYTKTCLLIIHKLNFRTPTLGTFLLVTGTPQSLALLLQPPSFDMSVMFYEFLWSFRL